MTAVSEADRFHQLNRLLNRLFRISPVLLALYWIGVFISTHMPQTPEPPEGLWEHFDKVFHFCSFFGLAFLCAAAWSLRTSLRWKHFLTIWGAVAVYGAVDELLQMLPVVSRVADFVDWLADIGGAAAGLCVFAALAAWARNRMGMRIHRRFDSGDNSPGNGAKMVSESMCEQPTGMES